HRAQADTCPGPGSRVAADPLVHGLWKEGETRAHQTFARRYTRPPTRMKRMSPLSCRNSPRVSFSGPSSRVNWSSDVKATRDGGGSCGGGSFFSRLCECER